MKQIMLFAITALLLLGCVQTPTHETRVVDDRPRVSFDVSDLERKPGSYYVRIDGIDFGSIDKYLRDKNALPLLPGQHTVEVLLEGSVVFSKKIYLGEKSVRVIKVVEYE